MRALLALGLLFGLLVSAAAEAAPYRLRVGDAIAVSVWQDSKLDRQLVVAPDGTIAFPLAGHLHAGGMTLEALESEIRDKLQANYKSDLDVTVTLATPASVAKGGPGTFYVTGEVAKPGFYPLNSPSTNTVQAIATSGGFGPYAAKRRILIYRRIAGRELRFTFNYRDFETGRDLSGNINLLPGDVVVVPEKNFLGF